MPCCLLATEEDLEINQEDDAYDCDNCPVADAVADLETDPANREAWALYRKVVSQFAVESHIVGLVLQHHEPDLSEQTFPELVERLAVIYDALNPPPEQKT